MKKNKDHKCIPKWGDPRCSWCECEELKITTVNHKKTKKHKPSWGDKCQE